MTTTCIYAGCGRAISGQNRSGYCSRCHARVACHGCGRPSTARVNGMCPACRAALAHAKQPKNPPPAAAVDALVAHYAARAALGQPMFDSSAPVPDPRPRPFRLRPCRVARSDTPF